MDGETEETCRKLFVGGLSWETNTESLRRYMSRIGEVVECTVKVDQVTGKSRGFGFVTFRTVEAANKVLETKSHYLDGKVIDPKKAVAQNKTGLPVTKKIFVGGIRSETKDDQLREYFEQFGLIRSIEFPMDHDSGKRRGFCFIEFEDGESAEKSMRTNYHTVAKQTVEVKPAFSKEQQQMLSARGLWPPLNPDNSNNSVIVPSMNIPSGPAINPMVNLPGIFSGMMAAAAASQMQSQTSTVAGSESTSGSNLIGMQNSDSTVPSAAQPAGNMSAFNMLYQTYIQYMMMMNGINGCSNFY